MGGAYIRAILMLLYLKLQKYEKAELEALTTDISVLRVGGEKTRVLQNND